MCISLITTNIFVRLNIEIFYNRWSKHYKTYISVGRLSLFLFSQMLMKMIVTMLLCSRNR